ncbi:MAG: acyltransferase [Sphingomonadales bacterium]|nr:acyltransferase [Sphingomonadales bacterium]
MRDVPESFSAWSDGARALAAMLVVASHARDVVMVDYPHRSGWLAFYAVTGPGHSGVILFFVLSGFWIGRAVWRRRAAQAFWQDYAVDRLTRLGIVLLPALLLTGALDTLGLHGLHLPLYAGRTGAHSLTENVAATLGSWVFVGNLVFLQTIAVPPFGSNGPLWSLAWEFCYYLWFPALVLSLARRRPSPALAALAAAFFNPALLGGFACWLSGWLLFIAVARGRRLPRAAPAAAALLFLALLAASGARRQGWTDLPLAIGFALLLFTLAQSGRRLPRWLAPLAAFGRRASFSLYAIHYPIIALAGGWLTGPARLAPSPVAVLWVLGLFALCLAAAWLFAAQTEARTGWLRARLRPGAAAGRLATTP